MPDIDSIRSLLPASHSLAQQILPALRVGEVAIDRQHDIVCDQALGGGEEAEIAFDRMTLVLGRGRPSTSNARYRPASKLRSASSGYYNRRDIFHHGAVFRRRPPAWVEGRLRRHRAQPIVVRAGTASYASGCRLPTLASAHRTSQRITGAGQDLGVRVCCRTPIATEPKLRLSHAANMAEVFEPPQ
jgi:hypothetical protein